MKAFARVARPAALTLAILVSSVLPAVAAATFEDQVMELVNQERWNNGQLAPLKRNNLLDSAALTHSTNMAVRNFFAHCDLDTKTSPWDRMNAAGYTGWSAAAENIAAGYSTPAAVMNAWMNSSGHRANILSTSVRELGIGYYYQTGDQANIRVDSNGDCTADGFNNGPYYRYWTQDFGRRNTVYPVVVNREAYETVNATVDLYVYGTGWAQEMRFRNEGGAWSAWTPFAANASWILSPGNGQKTVNAEIRNGSTVYAASDVIQLNASADLAVALTDSPDPATIGVDLTYRVIVTNSGGSVATFVSISDALPASVTFISASRPCSLNGSTLTCDLGTLGASRADTLDIVVRPTASGTVSSTASASAGEPDPNPANNSATQVTLVQVDPTGVPGDDLAGSRPALVLAPNEPNPFSTRTLLSWYLRDAGHVRLTIHDVAGRCLALLVDDLQAAGDHTYLWDGRDQNGQRLPAGLYFGRLAAAGQVRTAKLLRAR